MVEEERNLREILTDFDLATGKWTDEHPNEVVLSLGSSLLVLIDTNWGWLTKDGNIQHGEWPIRDVGLHPRTFASLDVLLGRADSSVNSTSSSSSSSSSTAVDARNIDISRVICVFPGSFVPTERNRSPYSSVDTGIQF